MLAADARFPASGQSALKFFAKIKLKDPKISDIYLFAPDQSFFYITNKSVENFIYLAFGYLRPAINFPNEIPFINSPS